MLALVPKQPKLRQLRKQYNLLHLVPNLSKPCTFRKQLTSLTFCVLLKPLQIVVPQQTKPRHLPQQSKLLLQLENQFGTLYQVPNQSKPY